MSEELPDKWQGLSVAQLFRAYEVTFGCRVENSGLNSPAEVEEALIAKHGYETTMDLIASQPNFPRRRT